MKIISKPILVTGSHRSGTSWVGRMIAQFGQIGEIWEPFNIFNRPGICAVDFKVWYPYINDNNGQIYINAIQDCLSFNYNYIAEIKAIRNIKDVARMGKDLARFTTLRVKRSRPLQKDPMAFFSAEWLAQTFDMQVIVLIRHPAAFAGSLKKNNWHFPFSHFLSQPALIANHLQSYENKIIQFAEKEQPLIPQANLLWTMIYSVVLKYQKQYSDWLFLRHEDLSSDPLTNFEPVYKYLGLQFSSEIKEKIKSFTGQHNPTERKRERSVHLSSIDNIYNWKKRLTHEEIVQIRRETAHIADNFYSDVDW